MLVDVVLAALAMFQETTADPDSTMLRIVCGVGAVVLVGLVVLRRRSRKKQVEDDF